MPRGFQLRDIDGKIVSEFLHKAGLSATPTRTLLENLALLTNENAPCNGAILLFARNPQRFFPEAQVKCARFTGTTSVHFIDEKTFDGNALSQLDQVLAFVSRNTRQEIKITGKAERDVIPEYPDDAVREAIVNAICHRDYAAVGTVQVRIYEDRLEVWNPGTLPMDLPIETLYREHPSRPQNPRIAQVLYRARLIEHWGTGTLRMSMSCQANRIKLEFLSEAGIFKVRLVKPVQGFPTIKEHELNPRQQKALEYVRENGKITSRLYQQLYAVRERQALNDLKSLMDYGILIRYGAGRKTYYQLVHK